MSSLSAGMGMMIFSYMAIEIWRYVVHMIRYKTCKVRTSGSNNICACFMDEIIDNVKKQQDIIKNLSYIFDSGDSKDRYEPKFSLLTDVTYDIMYNMILQNSGCNNTNNVDDFRDQKISELIMTYEQGISRQVGYAFKFTRNTKKKQIETYLPGRADLKPIFKPLLILGVIKVAKLLGYWSLWRKGFVTINGNHGMNYIIKRETNIIAKKNNKILIFFHGVGIGITPYINFVDIFQNYDEIILVELPNIGYGRHVAEYPTPEMMCESVMSHLIQNNPDVCKNISQNCSTKIDIAGHSYGSLLLSYLLRSQQFTETINFDKVYLFDSICFQESIYKLCRVMLFNLKQFVTFERKSSFGSLQEFFKTIERAIRYLFIFGDIETQVVIKRTIFLNEMSFPADMLTENVMVVITDNDMFINTPEVVNVLKKTPVKLMVMTDTSHGDMVMISSTKNKVKSIIEKFIESYPDQNDDTGDLRLDFTKK